jgi:hypothetical protein
LIKSIVEYELVKMAREKEDSRTALLKFGVALAVSMAGFLSIIKTKRIKPSQSPPSPNHSGSGNQADLGEGVAGLKSETTAIYLDQTEASIVDPIGKSCVYTKELLLPEFDEQFDIYHCKDIQTKIVDSEECIQKDQEIMRLKKKVEILKERERALEIQLLEYYGLNEQESAVLELQNRLKINNVESKLLNLKISSLQADNKKLEVQVADYAKVVGDLEAAQTQIKSLRKKLKMESERNREQILVLQERVSKIQDQEHEAAVSCDPDTQLKLQKLKELEKEVGELKKSNYNLQLEISDFTEKLEHVQIHATSVLEDEETKRLKGETNELQRQNEDLKQEIEQLQEDRCADAEELVYLRWVNACLRYDLRNYQPTPGKTVARDLSKSLSPKSEEKAKQLILEYANKEGIDENNLSISEIDLDRWSSSYLTDSGESEDSSMDNNSSTTKTNSSSKSRLIGKLMKLVRRKNGRRERNASVEDSSKFHVRVSTGNRSRRGSFDLHKLRIATDISADENKSDLMKYADALKGSRDKAPSYRRRSVSISSL